MLLFCLIRRLTRFDEFFYYGNTVILFGNLVYLRMCTMFRIRSRMIIHFILHEYIFAINIVTTFFFAISYNFALSYCAQSRFQLINNVYSGRLEAKRYTSHTN